MLVRMKKNEVLVDVTNMMRNPRLPGGLFTGGANDFSTQSRRGGDLQVQRATAMRLAAARSMKQTVPKPFEIVSLLAVENYMSSKLDKWPEERHGRSKKG